MKKELAEFIGYILGIILMFVSVCLLIVYVVKPALSKEKAEAKILGLARDYESYETDYTSDSLYGIDLIFSDCVVIFDDDDVVALYHSNENVGYILFDFERSPFLSNSILISYFEIGYLSGEIDECFYFSDDDEHIFEIGKTKEEIYENLNCLNANDILEIMTVLVEK
jgi:hypothetical protein